MSTEAPLRVGFHTFGCRSNHADTIELQAALVERGAVPCSADEAADVYVLNSCTVTDQADRDVLRALRRLRKRAPEARIVLTGCMASLAEDQRRDLPEVDAVVGAGRREEVLRAIEDRSWSPLADDPALVSLGELGARGRRPSRSGANWRSISLSGEMPQTVPGPGQPLGEAALRARYHLRVQEGCENSCTFCIIPQTRGRLSSRPLEQIRADLWRLAELGYEEVVLTGTHLGGYGEDRGLSLLTLLQTIAEERAVPRVRLSSIDPNDVSEEMIALLAGAGVFCEHLHVCMQAFSDPILKRMNRKYRMKEVRQLVGAIRSQWPQCSLGTDVICGFPGETRDNVEEQIRCFGELGFSYVHVFPYSERSDTPATRLAGAVETAERRKRAARWRAVGQRAKRERMRQLIGREIEIIVEQKQETAHGVEIRGTSREFIPAAVAAEKRIAERLRSGQRLRLKAYRLNKGEDHLRCELLNQES